jgi:hypothetical protein
MRAILALPLCLFLAACTVFSPFSGSGPNDTLAARDGSFSLKLPQGWAFKQQSESPDGLTAVAGPTAEASGRGYPTVNVREIREATPSGVLELMARDKDLQFTELWNVSPDRYVLKQVLIDDSSRVLTYWLAPRDARDLEYYGCITLTAAGRIEMIGVALSGSAIKYMRDFNTMFASLDIPAKSRPAASATPADTQNALRRAYARAFEREQDTLARLAAETAAWTASAQGLAAQEKNFLNTAYVKSAALAQRECASMAEAMAKPNSPDFHRHIERLDEAATALDTIALNIREPKAREAVDKTAARARRAATLGREAARLPM